MRAALRIENELFHVENNARTNEVGRAIRVELLSKSIAVVEGGGGQRVAHGVASHFRRRDDRNQGEAKLLLGVAAAVGVIECERELGAGGILRRGGRSHVCVDGGVGVKETLV